MHSRYVCMYVSVQRSGRDVDRKGEEDGHKSDVDVDVEFEFWFMTGA